MKNKLNLPIELILELINYIPCNLKWVEIKISKIFNILIFKIQGKCIIHLKNRRNEVRVNLDRIIWLLNNPIKNAELNCNNKQLQIVNAMSTGFVERLRTWRGSVSELFSLPRFDWPQNEFPNRKDELKNAFGVKITALLGIFRHYKLAVNFIFLPLSDWEKLCVLVKAEKNAVERWAELALQHARWNVN